MYYTGEGDKGTSKLFKLRKPLQKSEQIFEVLGTLDELNSFLGLCSIEAKKQRDVYKEIKKVQNNLFICQAHFAGAEVKIPKNLVIELEFKIKEITKIIRPKKNFVVPGGSKLSVYLDIARTLTRRTERQALRLSFKERKKSNQLVFIYLNRLSSFFYVLARYANDICNQRESVPRY
jgi:cob(I)alamin adenosyltransferase